MNGNNGKQLKTLRQILEVRGRLRKNPDDPKWHQKPSTSKMSKNNTEGGEEEKHVRSDSPHLETEPDQHIVTQLRVASDMADEKGGADVHFTDGSKHFVKHDVASNVISALEKLKPSDRGSVQDHIAKSHDNLMAVHKVI